VKNSSKKRASIIGIIKTALTSFLSFYLTPLMLVYFGKEDMGVYNIVLPLTAYFSMLDLGMHNVISRYIARSKASSNRNEERKYMGISLAFYSLMNLAILVFGFFVYSSLDILFNSSLTFSEIELLKSLFIWLTLIQMIKMFFNMYKGVIKAYEKFVLFKGIQLFSSVFRGVVAYIIIKSDGSISDIVILDVFVNLTLGILFMFYVKLKIGLSPTLSSVRFDDIKDIFSYSLFVFVNMLAVQMFWSTDNIVIGVLTNSVNVAIYTQGTMINSYFMAFSNIFTEFLMPSAVKLISTDPTKQELGFECGRIGRLILIPITVVVVVFTVMGREFVTLWLGKDYLIAYYVALFVMIPQIITFSQSYAANVMWAKGLHKKRSIPMFLISFTNLVLTIFLVDKMGIIGAAVGTCFAFVVGYVFYSSYYYYKYVGIDMSIFYKILLGKITIPILVTVSSGVLFKTLIYSGNWLTFIIVCAIITAVYFVAMYAIYMKDDERKIVNKYLKRVHLVR